MSELLTPEQAEAEYGVPSAVIERLVSDGMIDGRYARVGRTRTLYVPEEDAGAISDARAILRECMKAGRAPIADWYVPRAGVSGVYFVSGGEFVKIGMASCIRSRFAGLQTSSPLALRLIGWERCEDPRTRERELHQQFRAARSIGEWFRFTDDLKRHVGELTEYYFGLRGEVKW